MNLILLGPPGAGKGTMAGGIKEHYAIPHISTGDIFRTAIKNKTELGLKVQAIIESGELVPDDLTVSLVEERLNQPDAARGYILDGFPRTIPQAEAFDQISKITVVLNFVLSGEVVIRRLAGRLICRSCGEIFHSRNKPPKKDGICDVCGGELYTRPDDMEDAILNRLKVYEAQTAPLVEYYQKKGVVRDIDSDKSIEEMFGDVYRILG